MPTSSESPPSAAPVASGTPTGPLPRGSWWRRRIVTPVVAQLTQGVTPRRLSAALAVGVVLAVNPFLGTTTLACLAAGILFRLNQPALQAANVLAAPAQLALILPWVRLGEWLWGAPALPLSPTQLAGEFSAGPIEFLARFGRTGVHALTAWLLTAPLLGGAVYLALRPLLERLSRRRPALAEAPPP